MKFSLIAVAAFAGIASAQETCAPLVQSIPPCALGYIASYAYSSASCGLVDFQCQCSNLQKIAGGVAGPVAAQSGCDIGSVLPAAQSLCSCASSNAGQTISLNAVQSSCQPSAAAIPPCALGYLAEGAYSVAQCSVQDFACQCSNFDAIQSAIFNTVAGACGNSAAAVIQSASSLCACVSGGSGGGSGGSGSATPTGTGGSGSGPTTSGPAPTGSMGSGGSGSAPTSKSMSVFTGAGATPAVAFSGIFGVVAGLAAFL